MGLCLSFIGFSGRDQVVERDIRARERDRNREALLINVLRQHAQNRADRIIAVNNMVRDEHNRNFPRNDASGTSRGGGVGGSNPGKRKCPAYGTESVESWASTEVKKFGTFKFNDSKHILEITGFILILNIVGLMQVEQETFAFLWSLKNYSAFGGTDEVKSPVFKGGSKSNHSWQLKMCPKKKSDDLEYFSVHLILTQFGDGDASQNRKIKVRFQISILDADGRPGKQAGECPLSILFHKQPSTH